MHTMEAIRQRISQSTDPTPRRVSIRGDTVTTVAGVMLVAALFSDGWAHANVPELEGFFTPWHAALYYSFAVNALWVASLARRSAGLPVGYGWGAIGIVTFAVGGVLDMLWHLLLGVESGIDALVSPSHLVLLVGGTLLLTSALRSRWSAGDTTSVVAQGSLALASAVAAFFLIYVVEFASAAPAIPYLRLPEGTPGHVEGELPAIAGLGGFLISTAVMIVPLLLAWRRGRAPRGLVTLIVTVQAWLTTFVVDFPIAAVAGAVGATLGAVAADFCVQRLDVPPWPHQGLRLPTLAAITSALVWTGHLIAIAVVPGLAWPPELWSGVVVLASMGAAVLGALTGGSERSHGLEV